MAAPEQGKAKAVILYPSPGMGHLVPMMGLAKAFRHRGLSVEIVILDPPHSTTSTAAFISRVSAAYPSISFHRLPQLPHPPKASNSLAVAFELVRFSNPSLLRYLSSTPAAALVLDTFCLHALAVARQLRLPAYLFYTSGASCLSARLHLPSVHATITCSFKDLGYTPIHFPGVPPMPANHMMTPLLDRENGIYEEFLSLAHYFTEVDGIIVNTFEALEPAAIGAIRGGVCVPEGTRTPPIYCVGPLITAEDGAADGGDGAACTAWLDAQPRASVVFLCFGSMGRFSAEQLKETATGLEKSGHRFLWVVRSPPSGDSSEQPPEPDLDSLLPAGFLERTGGRGLVVKSWAPQRAVLAHESVGGFVTHLGWNSVLEALCAGVPMVGWPLYAEQKMNKVIVVEGLRLAGVVEGYDGELVTAVEVEARVRWLMESEGGRALRERASAAKEAAAAALRDGGSSDGALEELTTAWNDQKD